MPMSTIAITEKIGSQSAAIEAAKRALAMHENLAREHKGAAEFRSSLANAQSRLGSLLSEAGQTQAALLVMEQARSTEELLARDQPGVSRYQADLAKIHDAIGTLLGFRLGRNAEGFASTAVRPKSSKRSLLKIQPLKSRRAGHSLPESRPASFRCRLSARRTLCVQALLGSRRAALSRLSRSGRIP